MELASKFSLYDVLAIIIPGGIIMADIALWINGDWHQTDILVCCGHVISIKSDIGIFNSIILLAGAYIVGLINNYIADMIFFRFRNNRRLIFYSLVSTIQQIPATLNVKIIDIKHFRRLKPLNPFSMVAIIWKRQPKRIPITYYSSYYSLAKTNSLGCIPIIESQVALLRNCLFPFSLLALVFGLNGQYILALISLVLLAGSYMVMIVRQNKVYELVWESTLYYNSL